MGEGRYKAEAVVCRCDGRFGHSSAVAGQQMVRLLCYSTTENKVIMKKLGAQSLVSGTFSYVARRKKKEKSIVLVSEKFSKILLSVRRSCL